MYFLGVRGKKKLTDIGFGLALCLDIGNFLKDIGTLV
jgi:hypothetical protein